jgi:hypothetical protein
MVGAVHIWMELLVCAQPLDCTAWPRHPKVGGLFHQTSRAVVLHWECCAKHFKFNTTALDMCGGKLEPPTQSNELARQYPRLHTSLLYTPRLLSTHSSQFQTRGPLISPPPKGFGRRAALLTGLSLPDAATRTIQKEPCKALPTATTVHMNRGAVGISRR